MSMEYIGHAVTGTYGAVRSGVIAVKEKANPTGIFDVVHDKWETKDERGKVTLLHKLDRGFLDGYLQEKEGDITKLLDAIEATVPKYPICAQTLQQVHEFLGQKLPALSKRTDLLKRAITAMYLLRPEQLAPDITNKTFTNYVQDKAVREAIVSAVVGTLIKRENAKESNILVQTLEKNGEHVPFGTHAQITLKAFLAKAATESLVSCTYIDNLGNTDADDPINTELKAGKDRLDKLQARLAAIQETNAKEEQALQLRLESFIQRTRELAAQKEEQEKNELNCAREQKEVAEKAQALAKKRREVEELKARQEEEQLAAQKAAQLKKERQEDQEKSALKLSVDLSTPPQPKQAVTNNNNNNNQKK